MTESSGSMLRFTTDSVPRTPFKRQRTQIPLGLVATATTEQSLPTQNILPCTKCGAFPVLDPSGLSVLNTCPFCGGEVFIPPDLPLEYVVPSDPGFENRTVFVVDASFKSSGFASKVFIGIATQRKRWKNVALLTLSKEICFLMENGRVGVIPDLDGAVLPPQAFMKEMPRHLKTMLNVRQSEKGPDVYGCLNLLEKYIGRMGRIFLFIESIPTGEVSFNRVSPADENTALLGQNYTQALQELVGKFRQKGVIIDVFINGSSSVLIDGSTFGRMSAMTGGRVNYINQTQSRWTSRIVGHWLRCVDGSCKVRISQGTVCPSLGVCNWDPNHFRMASERSMYFPVTFAGELGTTIFVQFVMETREINGSYGTRVYNRILHAAESLISVYNAADIDAVLKYVSSSMISMFMARKQLSEMRDIALALLKPIFQSYRINVSRHPDRLTVLIMPKTLVTIPKWTLGLLKSTVFTPGIALDERGCQFYSLDRFTADELRYAAWPLLCNVAPWIQEGNQLRSYQLSEASMKSDRLLMLFDGFNTYLWLGKNLNRDLCMAVFGKPSPQMVDTVEFSDKKESIQLRNIVKGNIRHFVEDRGNCTLFTDRLIEDQGTIYPSHQTWQSIVKSITGPVT